MTVGRNEHNHAQAPLCAAFVADMREAFGEGQVKVLWVRENGLELGEVRDERAEV